MWDVGSILLSPEHQIKTVPVIIGYKAKSYVGVHSSTMDRWAYKEGAIDFSPLMSGHSIALETQHTTVLYLSGVSMW